MVGRYLMDFLVLRMRRNAIKRIVVSYSPSLAVQYVQSLLGFSEIDECSRFLEGEQILLVTRNNQLWIDCVATKAQARK